MSETVGLVLAAGLGKRMKSAKPKTLHEVGGLPIIDHIIKSLKKANVNRIIVVIGHNGDLIQAHLKDTVEYVWQHEQHGTGHAVMQAEPLLNQFEGNIMVLPGDTPLLKSETMLELIISHNESKSEATLLSMEPSDPASYGRIVRINNIFERIVEFKDADEVTRNIREVNAGVYCFKSKSLFESLMEITDDNRQKEYYLTDVLEIIKNKESIINVIKMEDATEGLGVNSKNELAVLEGIIRDRKRIELMEDGVILMDPKSTFIDMSVTIGTDTIIKPFCMITGDTSIGSSCVIGPSSNISNCIIGNSNEISSGYLKDSVISDDCMLGPYFQIRPGTKIANKVKIGHFVEIKNSQIGEGSKVPHLSYIGDSIVGKNVNIGCGVITCNYDGVHKYHTVIEDNSFIGSNSNLVAPVIIGKGSYVASGSTITKDVEPGALAVARSKQENKPGWVSRRLFLKKETKNK